MHGARNPNPPKAYTPKDRWTARMSDEINGLIRALTLPLIPTREGRDKEIAIKREGEMQKAGRCTEP